MVPVKAFVVSMKKTYSLGMPYLVGHDFHRPLGWTTPFGIFIEPGLSRFMAHRQMIENIEDQKRVERAVQNFVAYKIHETFDPVEKEFLAALSGKLKGDFKRIDCAGAAVLQEGIVKNVFPKLFEKLDKNGLIMLVDILSQFSYQEQGIFKHKKLPLCIYAHDYLRRNQSRFNNLNFHFLDALILKKDEPDIMIRLRIDEDMIGYTPSIHSTGELAFQWGPPYNDDISKIATGQITRHACEDWEADFYGIDYMDFYCKKENNTVVFEMEELKNRSSPQAGNLFHCHYIHGIYDLKTQSFEHFDGATRSYDEDEIQKRKDSDFVKYGRKSQYKKLFRIDGKLPLDKWKTLVTLYFQDNPLIYEYFGMGEERRAMMPVAEKISPLEKMLPYRHNAAEGIRLFVSYHVPPETLSEGRFVDVTDIMRTGDNDKMQVLEYRIHDVRIALERMGESLTIPDEVSYFTIDDNCWNIPSIMHNGEGKELALQKTVEAMVTLFSKMLSKGFTKLTTLTLSFTMDGRIIRISAFGHLEELRNWLRYNFPLSISEESFKAWVEKQRKFLMSFEVNISNSLPTDLIQQDGVMYMRRRPIPFPFDFTEEKKGLAYQIQFPKKEEDAYGAFELFQAGELGAALSIEIDDIKLSDTKESYFKTSRSLWLDEPVPKYLIYPKQPLALYWAEPKKG